MRRWLALALFVLSFSSQAKTLEVVVGLAKPPYVYSEGKQGFEIELVRHMFKQIGYDVNFVMVPFGRSAAMLNRPDVDVIMTVNSRTIEDETLLTREYITYQNVAVSLTANELTLEKISDLSNYSVAAFQNAHKVLGKEFGDAMGNSPLYIQSARQETQPDMLIKGKVQAVVMDINIFNYYAQAEFTLGDISKFTYHSLFPKTHYQMAIKDQSIKNKLNREIVKTKKSKFYRALIRKYQLSQ